MNKITETLILAGGFGTRLSSVVKNLPKPLAPINNVPFLTILMRFLIDQGIEHIILAVGYKHEMIQNFYGSNFEGIPVTYSIENEPLGTGGAIRSGLSFAKKEQILVVNGDSFIRFSLDDLEKLNIQSNEILIVLKQMKNFERYGSVTIDQNRITAFREKEFVAEGFINSGVYLLPRNLFDHCNRQIFSFEKDFLEKKVTQKKIRYFICNDYFIDIGIEEDYIKAQDTLNLNMGGR